MRIGEKGKIQMVEPAESVIIRAQENFDVDGGLNPVKSELEDDRITNVLKKKPIKTLGIN